MANILGANEPKLSHQHLNYHNKHDKTQAEAELWLNAR